MHVEKSLVFFTIFLSVIQICKFSTTKKYFVLISKSLLIEFASFNSEIVDGNNWNEFKIWGKKSYEIYQYVWKNGIEWPFLLTVHFEQFDFKCILFIRTYYMYEQILLKNQNTVKCTISLKICLIKCDFETYKVSSERTDHFIWGQMALNNIFNIVPFIFVTYMSFKHF